LRERFLFVYLLEEERLEYFYEAFKFVICKI